MKCIKTGCDVFLMEYGSFVHGDAFETASGDLVIRACHVDRKPQGSKRHFTVMLIDYWFDQNETSMARNGTIIVERGMFTNHGYDGIEEPQKAASTA